jgi:hypothetical protein
MKKMFSFSALFAVAILSMHTGLVSCTKEKTLYDTVTVTKRDTVTVTKRDTLTIKDTSITLSLLTSTAWKLQEIRGVNNNTPYFYFRGGTNSGQSYDNENITFYTTKTGKYVDPNGYSSSFTWDFVGTDSSKINYTVAFPTVTTLIHWENLRYKNGALYYDEYFTQNASNEHAQAVRIPISK